MEMNKRELPGYQMGFQEGFLKGQKEGLQRLIDAYNKRIEPIPIIIKNSDIMESIKAVCNVGDKKE